MPPTGCHRPGTGNAVQETETPGNVSRKTWQYPVAYHLKSEALTLDIISELFRKFSFNASTCRNPRAYVSVIRQDGIK